MGFNFVKCSFRSDGSGTLYTYKVPDDWEVSPGMRLKVPSRGGWKSVLVMETGVEEPTAFECVLADEIILPETEDAPVQTPAASETDKRLKRYGDLKAIDGLIGLASHEREEFESLKAEFGEKFL